MYVQRVSDSGNNRRTTIGSTPLPFSTSPISWERLLLGDCQEFGAVWAEFGRRKRDEDRAGKRAAIECNELELQGADLRLCIPADPTTFLGRSRKDLDDATGTSINVEE